MFRWHSIMWLCAHAEMSDMLLSAISKIMFYFFLGIEDFLSFNSEVYSKFYCERNVGLCDL